MAIIMGMFVGLIRDSIEQDLMLSDAEWKLAEQCGWEAIRA